MVLAPERRCVELTPWIVGRSKVLAFLSDDSGETVLAFSTFRLHTPQEPLKCNIHCDRESVTP